MTKPALILGYKRIDGIGSVIRTLIENKVSRIYVSLDGPKSAAENAIQDQIIDLIASLCKKGEVEFFVKTRPKNLGIKQAVLSGVDWFFSIENEGYIFEDDLVISSDFFTFCETLSARFNSTKNALLISGNQFFPDRSVSSAMTLNYPLIWGWYTNSTKWILMRKLVLNEFTGSKQRLSPHVRFFWEIGLWKSQRGFIDSWAIPLAANFRFFGFNSIIPPVNLVGNFGLDEHASHTLTNQPEMHLPTGLLSARQLQESIKIEFAEQNPQYIEETIYRIRSWHALLAVKLLFLRMRHRKTPKII